MEKKQTVYYAGFWSRALGVLIDTFMIGLPITLVMMLFFGHDAIQEASLVELLQGQKLPPPNPLMSWIQILLFGAITVLLWRFDKGQTPGKRLAKITVVDATTLMTPSWWQLIIRFVGYTLSFISIVGFLLPLVLPKKQALHDLLAHTVVIYEQRA